MRRGALHVLLTSILPLVFLFAKEIEPMPVEVVDLSDDMVGERLVYYVKEGIRESNAFRLTNSDESRVKLIISTMDRFQDTPNISSQYCVVWVFVGASNSDFPWPIYLNHTIGYCGSDVVKTSAEGIVASTDRLISEIQKYWQQ